MTQVDVVLNHVTKSFVSDGITVHAVDDVSLEIPDGEFFALLGPSGCGKTTTLRMIAGFEQPTSGEIIIRGQQVQGVPPFHRPVNTVFQDYALFPHLSTVQNVAFGLEMEGVKRREAQERAAKALDMVQIPRNAFTRRPSQMSGGQQQRVALARALVKEPAVLLLDEPLGALDLKLRKAMQYELKAMQQRLGITFIYVTHDQEEALTMADRIAVMKDGKVQQCGAPAEIYEAPTNRFVADFIGETNFVEGVLVEKTSKIIQDQIDEDTVKQTRLCKVRIADDVMVEATLLNAEVAEGAAVTIGLRPERVEILPTKGRVLGAGRAEVPVDAALESARNEVNVNIIAGEIVQQVYIGTDTRYIVRIGGKVELAVRMQNLGAGYDVRLHAGESCYVLWDAENARVLTT